MSDVKKILTINLGSTSTKLAYFENDNELSKWELELSASELEKCKLMLEQLPLRLASVQAFIEQSGIEIGGLDMIVTRGGSVHGVRSGAYVVDEHVVAVHSYAPRSQMPSSLAAVIGYELARPHGVPVIFYDAPSADDADEAMHLTGLPEARRFVTSHTLNAKAAAHEIAAGLGRRYEDCNFIVAHMGGGTTIGFHKKGRIVDTVLDDAGPMSPQRAGRIPVTDVINLCFSGRYSREDMVYRMRGGGGLVAHFGVQDVRVIEQMIRDGDKRARAVYEQMAYQTAKGIAELTIAGGGELDAVILTGGLARSELFTGLVSGYVGFIAPVKIIPGEREMLALARGGLRVLSGEETAQRYTWLPEGTDTLESFIKKYKPS